MEEKHSFYDYLVANSSAIQKEPQRKIHPFFFVLSWLIIFIANSTVLWISWNYAVSSIFHLSNLSFIGAILLYSAAKTLTRGFISTQ